MTVISVLTYQKTYTTTSFLFHKYSSQTVHNTQRLFGVRCRLLFLNNREVL